MTAPHLPMMNDEGLLECPFCAGVDDVMESDTLVGNLILHNVSCMSCGAQSGNHYKMQDAVKKWNTRNGHLWTKQDFADRAFEMQNSDLLEKK